MAQLIWSQDVFTKGEISPLMYARVSVAPYYNGLKTATNVITFPQGAAGKRFGTFYQNTIQGVTDANQIYFQSMQYLNECVYLIVFIPGFVNIYLEGNLVQQIANSPIGANLIRLLDHTVLDNIFRVTCGLIPPQDVTRSPDSSDTITAFDTVGNTITLTTGYTAGYIYPVRFSFTPGGINSLFTSNPQVLSNKTYFLYMVTSTVAQIYYSAPQAKAQINPFQILSAGVGAQQATILNTWSIAQSSIVTYPVFDFTGGRTWQKSTFTVSVLTGNAINLTFSAGGGDTFTFTSAYIGGVFFAPDGGRGRILSITSPTVAVIASITSFSQTTPYLGSMNLSVTTPAWSNAAGWPRVCSSFQNRAFFSNTDLLPNGLWGSVVNDYDNFDDSQVDSDNAISWYPTSDDINFIRFIVPYRSLTIHTNSGVFSTPLSVEIAITPLNFSLTIQDSTPAEAVQPRGIDNQIVILSGNDAHSLLWDGFNNAYQSNIISVANEHLIRDPVDEAAFVDLTRAGSRYMLIVNADGSLAIYQTLISEDVQGFTPAYLEQTYGNAYFRWVATSYDGRGWFVTEREIAVLGSPIPITNYTQFTLGTGVSFELFNNSDFNLLNGDNLDFLQNENVFPKGVTPFEFTSGTLPLSNPQVMLNTWYWAVPTDTFDFMVYTSAEDAEFNLNPIEFFNAGTNANITAWVLETQFFIEELSFEAKVDCAYEYMGRGASTAIFPNLPRFNAQDVKINGDGYGFDYIGMNDTVETIAHGQLVPVSFAQIGFPINVTIEPLPLSIFQGSPKQSNLQTPKHIRDVTLMLADTIGGLVNGIPIALQNFADVPIGSPPVPVNGEFEYGIMAGWDDYKKIGLTITHNEPFDFKLIGLFYKVDV
jgi:hypothetical protein